MQVIRQEQLGNISVLDKYHDGYVDLSGARLINMAPGTLPTDAVTKAYVDGYGFTTTSLATGLQTTGATVNVSAANPPAIGQVLTATSATTAVWGTPTSNTVSNILDRSDATETLLSSVSVPVSSLINHNFIISNYRPAVATAIDASILPLSFITRSGLDLTESQSLTNPLTTATYHTLTKTGIPALKGPLILSIRVTAGLRKWVYISIGYYDLVTAYFNLEGAGAVGDISTNAVGTISLVSGSTYDITLSFDYVGALAAQIIVYIAKDGSTHAYVGDTSQIALRVESLSVNQPMTTSTWQGLITTVTDGSSNITVGSSGLAITNSNTGSIRIDTGTAGFVKYYVAGQVSTTTQWSSSISSTARSIV